MSRRKIISLTVLFADIAGSTSLYEKLGDLPAQRLMSDCMSKFTTITKENQGNVVKTIGDEIMCIFRTANDAVQAGIEMQQVMESVDYDPTQMEQPNIYVGLHYGSVIIEGGDVFGDTVNMAARMVGLAKQRQIIITEAVYKLLEPDLQENSRFIEETKVKGKDEKCKVYETIWEVRDATIICGDFTDLFGEDEAEVRLEVTFQSNVLEINQGRPAINIGRQAHNDLVVSSKSASRTHGRIEMRNDKFYYVDQSSNGSYIVTEAGASIHIRQNESPLEGMGVIFLGRKGEISSPEAIRYEVFS